MEIREIGHHMVHNVCSLVIFFLNYLKLLNLYHVGLILVICTKNIHESLLSLQSLVGPYLAVA